MDNIGIFFLVFGFSNHSLLLDSLMIFATRYLIYLSILFMFILAFKAGIKEKKTLLLAILAIPIAILLIKGVHLFFYEPRPFVNYHFSPLADNTPDASFPSRHATIMAVLAFAYTYFKSKWSPFFLFLMVWVGLSRIYIGVHYPLDVLGGFLVGIISLIISLQIKKLLRFNLPN